MNKKLTIMFMILLIILIACTTGEIVRKDINPGMSKDNLITMLGNPDGFRMVGDQELLTYTNRLISGWSYDRADYHFVIKNNKVIAYGTGEVRVKQDNTILIIPIK